MQELVDLERRLWLEGAGAFEELLSADAIAIMPMEEGIHDRAETVRAIMKGTHWDALDLGAIYSTHISEGVVMLSYEAQARRGEDTYRALCSSLWRADAEGWRLAHHQQTPSG